MNERTFRRAGWTEGHWLDLGDGQRWCLPHLEFKPSLSIRATGAALPAECPTIPEIFGYTELFMKADGVGQQAFVIRYLIARLLKQNYVMDDDEAKALLPFGVDGFDPGFESGVFGEALKAVDALIMKPAERAAILGITPPGVN